MSNSGWIIWIHHLDQSVVSKGTNRDQNDLLPFHDCENIDKLFIISEFQCVICKIGVLLVPDS